MSEAAPLLIEIGVEEMPAGLPDLLQNELEAQVNAVLAENGISIKPNNWQAGSTPRRLLLHCRSCPVKQPDRDEVIWGPPEKVAFGTDGKPARAAEGFAKKTGLALEQFTLEDKGDGKVRYMKAVLHRKGREVASILAGTLPGILRGLSPKQMKWHDGEGRNDTFIRPVRWIVARLGNHVIPFAYAGVKSGKISYGHRIHGSSGEIDVASPIDWLRSDEQRVYAFRGGRWNVIRDSMGDLAAEQGLEAVVDDDLLDEVTDLTEWPVPLLAGFNRDYLKLPEQVIRIVLKKHQRCFITHDEKGKLSNRFVAVANLESKDPSQVAHGNARVVNARLADAAFYFERDPEVGLEARVERLNEVIFQQGLGTVGDQVMRLRGFALDMAAMLGADTEVAQRAAYLSKSDLTTGLVAEFPELQGYMGGVYARVQGESEKVVRAIAEHYLPETAEDGLPSSPEARVIGIAERLDKLLGYFHIGREPSASADPYGLRRAAIGLIHLLTGKANIIDVSLDHLLEKAARQWNQQRVTIAVTKGTQTKVKAFIIERLMRMAGELGVSRPAIDAALAAGVERSLYAHLEVACLLTRFADSETGQAVAFANKRIANILRQAGAKGGHVDEGLLKLDAERGLYAALQKAQGTMGEGNPKQNLDTLAGLREPVDRFFDDVMVMCEDKTTRNNRLALLVRLRGLFLQLADVSRL